MVRGCDGPPGHHASRMSTVDTDVRNDDRRTRRRRRLVVIAVTAAVLSVVVAVVAAAGSNNKAYSVRVQGRVATSAWRLETGGSCRRVRFTPPLARLKGYESNLMTTMCGDGPTMADSGDPLELLAIGRTGNRVVVALDAAPEVKKIRVDDNPSELRPSKGTVFLYVGSRPPETFRIHGAGWDWKCWLDKQGAPDWWLNCSGSGSDPLPN